MSIFKIQIKAGKPATFNPNPQTVYVNDSVFWFNGDPKLAHWPAPSAANPKGFLEYQVVPNSSSNQVGFGKPKTISYICVNHPGETGKIIVKSRKKKGAYGGKTKKGAFARKTKLGAVAGKTKLGAVAGKTKLGAVAGKTKLGAVAGKTKLGAVAGKTKLGAVAGKTKKGAYGKVTKKS